MKLHLYFKFLYRVLRELPEKVEEEEVKQVIGKKKKFKF
jgi:hypothetical protein